MKSIRKVYNQQQSNSTLKAIKFTEKYSIKTENTIDQILAILAIY
jgi:hypothetical protein